MQIQIMSRNDARRFSFSEHDFSTAIISIVDPDKCDAIFNSEVKNGIKHIFRLRFDDEEEEARGCIADKDAQSIAEFVRGCINRIDLLIVHCEAGVSRSAGVAAAIMKWSTGSDMAVFNDPKYSPNMKCYRKVLNELYYTVHIINNYSLRKRGKRFPNLLREVNEHDDYSNSSWYELSKEAYEEWLIYKNEG